MMSIDRFKDRIILYTQQISLAPLQIFLHEFPSKATNTHSLKGSYRNICDSITIILEGLPGTLQSPAIMPVFIEYTCSFPSDAVYRRSPAAIMHPGMPDSGYTAREFSLQATNNVLICAVRHSAYTVSPHSATEYTGPGMTIFPRLSSVCT